jgi:hypothetical protein
MLNLDCDDLALPAAQVEPGAFAVRLLTGRSAGGRCSLLAS